LRATLFYVGTLINLISRQASMLTCRDGSQVVRTI